MIHSILPGWTSRLGVLVCPTVNISLSASLVRSKVVHSTIFDVNVSVMMTLLPSRLHYECSVWVYSDILCYPKPARPVDQCLAGGWVSELRDMLHVYYTHRSAQQTAPKGFPITGTFSSISIPPLGGWTRVLSVERLVHSAPFYQQGGIYLANSNLLRFKLHTDLSW